MADRTATLLESINATNRQAQDIIARIGGKRRTFRLLGMVTHLNWEYLSTAEIQVAVNILHGMPDEALEQLLTCTCVPYRETLCRLCQAELLLQAEEAEGGGFLGEPR